MRISKTGALIVVAAMLPLSVFSAMSCGGGSGSSDPIAAPSPVSTEERVTDVYVIDDTTKSLIVNTNPPTLFANNGEVYSQWAYTVKGQNFDTDAPLYAYSARIQSLDGTRRGPSSGLYISDSSVGHGQLFVTGSFQPNEADTAPVQVQVIINKLGVDLPANTGLDIITLKYDPSRKQWRIEGQK